MDEPGFLGFVLDRFTSRSLSMHLRLPGGRIRKVNLPDLSECGFVITHDSHLLLEALRRGGLEPPATLVDIREALKLESQVARDQGGDKQWNVWRRLAGHFSDSLDADRMASLLLARSPPLDDTELDRLTQAASGALEKLWSDTSAALEARGELARFLTVEIPIQQIFHHREISGLRVDAENINNLIRACENEKFSLFRKLADELGFSPLGISDVRLTELLLSKDEQETDEWTGVLATEDWLDLAHYGSRRAGILLDYFKAKRDLAVLQETSAGSTRVFPQFHVHGTVTSRILVSEPRLQQLRRRYRAVLRADDGWELSYLDYAQFEPGILAFLASDKALQEAYRGEDVYVSLAGALGEGVQSRNMAKRVFLASIYGMNRSAIARLVDGSNELSPNAESTENRLAAFFSTFPGIEAYRRAALETLRAEEVIGTKLGNGRRRTQDKELTRKEERWAINHPVQATASLIFKTALLNISTRFGWRAILLPMHDAALLQFSPAHISREQFERECVGLMQDAFASVFPGVVAKVTATPFAPVAEPRYTDT